MNPAMAQTHASTSLVRCPAKLLWCGHALAARRPVTQTADSPRRQHTLAAVGSTGTIQARHAHTRVWRPHIDDVDRLSRGEAAKIRGTGCRDIPHRLNIEEHEVFKAAKKKGYLAVRGTGYRRERKGNPLPNVFRQWCDARACVCIVIEQDLFGGPVDQVVVDLSTLRLIGPEAYAQARQTCTEVAASLGIRPLEPSERDATAVPFNILPLVSGGSSKARGAGHKSLTAAGLSSGSPQNVVMPQQAGHARDRGSDANAGASGGSRDSTAAADLPQTGADADIRSSQQQQSALPVEELERWAAQLQADVQRQAAAVKALKEGEGRGNTDAEVQAQVQQLLKLKAEAAAAEQQALDARAQAAIKQLQAKSARRAALFDAFDDVASMPADAVPQQQEQEEKQEKQEGLHSSQLPESRTWAEVDKMEQADQEEDEQLQGSSLGMSHDNQDEQRDQVQEPQGSDEPGHPYCRAAIWQLPADPLFFQGDRPTVKLFAKQVLEQLCSS